MAKTIGIRELKNQASSIVRQVREEAVDYVITHHGRPVAVLRPVDEQTMRDLQKQEAVDTWRKLLEIGRKFSASQISEKSARELLSEMREEENGCQL